MKTSENVRIAESGLLEERFWRSDLKRYETGFLGKIRQALLQKVPGLAEKYNRGKVKYFGYRREGRKDSVYVYVQKKGLRIDLNLPRNFEDDLKQAGFTIKHQENFQGKAGWLTGWRVPHGWERIEEVIKWLRLALERS